MNFKKTIWFQVGELCRIERKYYKVRMEEICLDLAIDKIELMDMEHGRKNPLRLINYWLSKV